MPKVLPKKHHFCGRMGRFYHIFHQVVEQQPLQTRPIRDLVGQYVPSSSSGLKYPFSSSFSASKCKGFSTRRFLQILKKDVFLQEFGCFQWADRIKGMTLGICKYVQIWCMAGYRTTPILSVWGVKIANVPHPFCRSAHFLWQTLNVSTVTLEELKLRKIRDARSESSWQSCQNAQDL